MLAQAPLNNTSHFFDGAKEDEEQLQPEMYHFSSIKKTDQNIV